MLGHREFKVKSILLCILWLLASSTATTLYKSPAGTPPQTHYDHVIPVHGNANVTDCSESSTDLNEPLSEAFKYNKSIQLQLSEGCFIVTSNDLATFSGWTDFAIVGKGSDLSVLTCADGVGLAFLSSTRIVFRGVRIKGCTRVQNSTSKNFTADTPTSKYLSFLQFWVGVYFLSCGDITMDSVEVSDTEGVGVVMYNCNGTNMFTFSTFKMNFRDDDELFHSGNVAIEFSFCQPGDTNCRDSEPPSFQVAQSVYTFHQCKFQYSDAGVRRYNGPIVPYPHGTEHVAFGKGAGLSVIFKGRSSGNSINIDSCKFNDNSAQWGGGLYTSFGDQSIDNKVTVAQSQFNMNINRCQGNSRDWHQSGGGAQVDFIYYPADNEVWPGYQPDVLRNSVSFYKTDFASNMACWGGAVSVVVSRESPGQSVTNSVLFDGCRFNYNQASIAAAVDVSILQPDLVTSNGMLMKPVFKDCEFVENAITFTDATNKQLIMGAVYANLVPLNFTRATIFTRNDGTALVVSGTYVTLSESSKLTFDSNTGRHGGALAFIGNSWLVAYKNVQVTFTNNSAETLGGAIYSVHFGEHDLMYKQNCFFQYYKATLHPSRWNATFVFTENHVRNEPNSIYTTSLLPCIWPDTSTPMSDVYIANTFCGHPWTFDNNTSCRSEVSTGPSNLNLSSINVSIVPGWPKELPVTALNDYGHTMQTVFTAAPCTGEDKDKIRVSNITEYIADNNIIVQGVTNSSANILLRTLDPRVISSQLRVDIQGCPPAYSPLTCPDDPEMICNCICTNSFYGVGCHNESHDMKVYRYNCLTYWHEEDRRLVSGRCPYHQNHTSFESFANFSEEQICGGLNRQGTLCSKCKDGYGVSVNSYNFKCVKCDTRYSWVFYILAELVPIIIFFVIVALFNISATSAPMNAFVFFSQMVTIPYFHNPHTFTFGILFLNQTQTRVLEAFISIPYSIWNLDFFTTSLIPGFCLDHSLSTLNVISLKYLNAFLPLLLIVICYILFELHGRNYRSIRCMWHPFRCCLKKIYKNREPKTSIIDAFATFLLLSYSKIMYLSFSLFAPNCLYGASGKIRDQVYFYFDASQQMFSGKHAVLVITALVIFAFFVILPPVFLILYPLRCFQRIIDKLPFRIALRTFAEAFNGDFRDGTYKDGRRGDSDCRRYAGYYFLFRVVVFTIFVSERKWLEQYFIQQVLASICVVIFASVKPYKVDFYNKVDTAFFLLLSLLNAFSSYNSQLYYNDNYISKPVFWINYLLAFLPLVYLISYIVYLILLWKGYLKKWTKIESPISESVVIINDPSSIEENEASEAYNSDKDVPDRLVNPQNYNSRNLYKPHDENVAALLRQERPRQGSSEKSYFNARRDPHLVPYGSFVTSGHHTEPIMRPNSLSRKPKGSSSVTEDSSTKNASSKGSSVRFQGVV